MCTNSMHHLRFTVSRVSLAFLPWTHYFGPEKYIYQQNIKDTDKYTENEQKININRKWSHDVSVLCEILSVDFSPALLETNPPSTPHYRELPLPQSSLSQRKKVSIEEWRNSVIEGGDEIREGQVQDAQEWEVEPSSFWGPSLCHLPRG